MRAALAATVVAALAAGGAGAHDGARHATAGEAAAHAAATPRTPFPVEITAAFDLIDQTGARRTAESFRGAPMLVFFGYASCEAICDVALPRMAEALDLLGPAAARVTPVMITVDPERDTPARLAKVAPAIHPRLVALTGSPQALAAARSAFGASVEKVAEGPDGAPIFAHASFMYLIGPDGRLMTVLPPILAPERIAEIVAGYL